MPCCSFNLIMISEFVFLFDSMYSSNPKTKFALFWTRSAGSRLGTNWTKNFSIELHKANLLGLEVQYYPYHPAPLSPFPGPSLASLPKLPAQM